MSDSFSRDDLADVVGVIDLLGGAAVHAVAGNRASYRPVGFCDGNPVDLARHYLDAGANSLYIADLDSIQGRVTQSRPLEAVFRVASGRDVYVDIGWNGEPSSTIQQTVVDIAESRRNIHWIAATESCVSTDGLQRLAQLVSPDRTLLGLDYRHGEIIDQGVGEEAWLRSAEAIGVRDVVVLDLASVGSGRGPSTAEICRRIKSQSPCSRIFSGGGIRDGGDIEALRSSGCDRFLIATGLFPKSP